MPSLFPPNLLPFSISGNNLITQDLAQLGILPPTWGVFTTTAATSALTFDSVVAFEYRHDFTLSDYPIEQGAFASYDKVQHPWNIRMIFSAGGAFSNRQQFLLGLESLLASTNLFNVVTPEVTYLNNSCVHIDYDRRATRGLGLVQAAAWFEAVNLVSPQSAASQSTQSPSGSPLVVGGQVQATATQSSSLLSSLSSLL